MRAPIRLVRGGWPPVLERRLARFVRDDPSAVVAGTADDEMFSRAMSLLHVGDTIKITGPGRHQPADALLLDHVDLTGKTLVDLGASDGSTSIELIERTPQLAAFVIADLYLSVSVVRTRRHLVFYDPAGSCMLVVGRRLMAWPALSRPVRLLYRAVDAAGRRRRAQWQELLLLKPSAQAILATDERVTATVHDVFQQWSGPPPDVIKVANVLRRLYFSDSDIERALAALHASLAADGHLLMVDNPRIAGITVRAGLYRRTAHGFARIASTEHEAEIDDLVTSFAAAPAATP